MSTLFRMNLKGCWKMLLALLAALLLYFTVITMFYDPEGMEALDNIIKALPNGVMDAFGMGHPATTLTGMLANYFFGFIVLLFPTILMIVLANGLMAKHIDRGSMANLLATPHSRWAIAGTQAAFLFVAMAALQVAFTLLSWLIAHLIFPGELAVGPYWQLNLAAGLTFFALSGMVYAASCLSNDTSHAMVFVAGIPVLFFLMKMIGQAGDKFQWVARLSLYAQFSPIDIAQGAGLPTGPVCLLLALGVAGYGLGIVGFAKRNLPI